MTPPKYTHENRRSRSGIDDVTIKQLRELTQLAAIGEFSMAQVIALTNGASNPLTRKDLIERPADYQKGDKNVFWHVSEKGYRALAQVDKLCDMADELGI